MHDSHRTNTARLLLSLILLFPFLSACRSTGEESAAAIEEPFMARPRILVESSRASLPLRLQWESVSGAKGYELQISDSENFNSSLRNLTITQSSFLLEELDSSVLYIRVRSIFDGGTSRWSETLQVSVTDGEIHLQRLR